MRTAQIVLAAGRGRRMGKPKALLDFDGRTALRLVVEAAAAAGVETSAIVVGHRAADVMAAHDFDDLPGARRWVLNEDEESEQVVSLQLGLRALGAAACEWFFIHPVDYPLVTAADYRLLLQSVIAEAGSRPYREPAPKVGYLSHAHHRGHPVLCRGDLAPAFLALGPAATAREILEREPCAYVLTGNAGVLEDMDTPEDYQRILSLYRAAQT